jgi:hypothetical protein
VTEEVKLQVNSSQALLIDGTHAHVSEKQLREVSRVRTRILGRKAVYVNTVLQNRGAASRSGEGWGSLGDWPPPPLSAATGVRTSARLLTRRVYLPPTPKRPLLKLGVLGNSQNVPSGGVDGAPLLEREDERGVKVPHWVSRVDVSLVSDSTPYPLSPKMPPLLAVRLRATFLAEQGGYLPVVSCNDAPSLPEHRHWLHSTNHSLDSLPIVLRFRVSSTAAHTFRTLMVDALSVASDSMGLEGKDVEDMVRMLLDTPHWLLVLAFTVSTVHLLLDFLSLRSEVSFWSSASESVVRRLSFRALLTQAAVQLAVSVDVG